MNLAHTLTRDDVLRDIDWLGDDPEFLELRPMLLGNAIISIDHELARCLLVSGADPNVGDWCGDGPLQWLWGEYLTTRGTKGAAILSLVELLLEHGCDPNHVGYNNKRAYDLAMEHGCMEFASLLASAGALPEIRPFI